MRRDRRGRGRRMRVRGKRGSKELKCRGNLGLAGLLLVLKRLQSVLLLLVSGRLRAL
jgi:hypothetical protein